MADEYNPPLSPDIVWVFKRPDLPYNPPLSPDIVFIFGADDDDDGDDGDGYRKSSYMILLTM